MKISNTIPVVVFITLLFSLPGMAQPWFTSNALIVSDRAKEVMQDNEFPKDAQSNCNFFSNPLLLNDQPLDYNHFSLESKGQLKLVKGGTGASDMVEIPFYVYLRRNGTMIPLPGDNPLKQKHMSVDISTIMKLAQPGDHLIIEPVNKDDWQSKRILKLLEDAC
jgi:hypothetical protein